MSAVPENARHHHIPVSDGSASAIRLAYLVSHPIQYQAPLLRRIAQEPDIELTVFFGSDFSVRDFTDPGFGVTVKWDVPLLEGYKHQFLDSYRDNGTDSFASPISKGLFTTLGGPTKERRFDALWVHGYATMNSLQAILTAKALGIPVLIRAESWLKDRSRSFLKVFAKRIFFAFLRYFVDGVLVIGTRNRMYWEHYFGKNFPFFLMPYSVDNEYFRSRAEQASPNCDQLRKELNLEPDRPVVLFASKLQSRKHCNDLVEAYSRLAPAPGLDPHPYLVIVGDGEERESLEEQAKQTGFSSIRFCGFRNQSELPRFFNLCSVFVLPSRHEPWGLIVNEVMNAARPVILSDDVGCAVDLVTNGVEGYIFPVRDVDALTQALRLVLESPERTTVMGKNALQRINEWNFDADVRGLKQALFHITGKQPV